MKSLLIIIAIISVHICRAQDSIAMKKFELNGYVKNLQIIDFDKTQEHSKWNSIIHNRINTKWKINDHYTFAGEVRNRAFLGEDIHNPEDFAERLRNTNEYFDMQAAWIKNSSIVLHTNIERLYIDYRKDKFAARIGRQRINWGVTTTWNPNDIFNTYDFLDFDYEERPGSDGAKLYYKFKDNFNAEMAYTASRHSNGDIAAVKVSINKWNYDLQLNSGYYKNNLTIGLGWAGYIKSAGFKGEAQYFKTAGKGDFNLSLEGDYMFKKGWYVNAGILYNDYGITDLIATEQEELEFTVSPENLMPARWNTIFTIAKEINPLWALNTSIVYSPGINLFILYPSLKFNILQNLELNFVIQTFYAGPGETFKNISHRMFLRIKWSF